MSRKFRICLIDDDVILLGALASGLREAGYIVFTAPGAAAGLDVVTREGADVIVTDMRMPGTSGSELIQQARSNWPGMIIIAMSGLGSIDGAPVVDLALARGASAFIHKPLRVAELIHVLNELAAKTTA